MKIGDKVILRRVVDCPEIDGKGGVITDIIEGLYGETTIYGTWGDTPIFPELDWIEVVDEMGTKESLLSQLYDILTPDPQTVSEIWRKTEGSYTIGNVAILLRELADTDFAYATELDDTSNDSVEKAYGLI
jgi:hypothetical protein